MYRSRTALNLKVKSQKLKLDSFGVFIGILGFLIGLYIYTYVHIDFIGATSGLYIMSMILGGLVFGLLVLKEPLDLSFMNFSRSAQNLKTRLVNWQSVEVWLVAGVLSASALQILTTTIGHLATVGINSRVFYTGMAIGEEYTFRFAVLPFLFTWFTATKNNLFYSSIVCSVVFMFYHVIVYQADPISLMFVFAASMVLCVVALKTKNLTTSLIVHMIANFAAG